MSQSKLGEHTNAFGFLRLVMASLVIVAHTPELVDGTRQRELFTLMFGSTSFGGIAVDGFFVLSGFLITGSFLSSRSAGSYLLKRITRIYPGFLFAYLLCIVLVGPLSGATMPQSFGDFARLIVEALFLHTPRLPNSFDGLPYPILNGATWTIAYEFRCYLMIMVLGMVGVLRSRRLVLALAIASTILALLLPNHPYTPYEVQPAADTLHITPILRDMIIGNTRHSIRFIQIFLTGACFYLYRDHLRFSRWTIALAAVLLVAGLFSERTVHIAMAIFGGYLMIAFAFSNTNNIFARINNKEDISYGLYLAGWPVEKLLIWFGFTAPLFGLGLTTLVLACAYGFFSWRLIERPMIRLSKGRRTTGVNIGEQAEIRASGDADEPTTAASESKSAS